MLIDAHVHFWHFDAAQYPWIGATQTELRRDRLPDDWRAVAEPLGFEGVVAVQARPTLEETEWLLELAQAHECIRAVVGWVDLRGPALDEQLEVLCDHTRLVGVRHLASAEPELRPAEDDLLMRGIARLGHYDLALDLLINPEQLPATTEMAAHFPRQRFVINHIAKPNVAAGEIEPWAGNLRALAEHPGAFCKLSGLTARVDPAGWSPEQLHPWLDVVLDAFGPERLMIGSDWPVCLPAGSYERTMEIVMTWMRRLPEDARRGILGANCARGYGLQGAA